MYRIIKTGSSGNAVLYSDILVDTACPYQRIPKIKLVLLTHQHTDHFCRLTISKIAKLQPLTRFGCGEFLFDLLNQIVDKRRIDVYEAGQLYDYGKFQVSPVKLYHDVPNFGYRIFIDGKKIFHATDTQHLEGITAQGYDLYALEHNYDEDRVWQVIREKEEKGLFAHQRGSINTHLSVQQAQDFFLRNKKEESVLIRLHESKEL